MPNQSTSRYILTALAIVLVITAFILVGLNAIQIQKRIGVTTGKLSNQLPIRINVTTAAGSIQSISGTTLKLVMSQINGQAVAIGQNDIRTINVTTSTTIVRSIQKSPEVLKKELAAFSKNPPKPGSQQPILPMPMTFEKISISDLKNGDVIYMTGVNGFADSNTLQPTTISVRTAATK